MKAVAKDYSETIDVPNETVKMINHCHLMGNQCNRTSCPYDKECEDFDDSHHSLPCHYMVLETTLPVYDELLTKVRGMDEQNKYTTFGKLGYYECMIDVFPEHTEELLKDVSKIVISMVKNAF